MHKMKPNDFYDSSLLGLLLVFDITLVRLKLQIDLTITKLNSLKSWVSTDWPLCKSITWSNQHCHWFTRWNQLIGMILLSNTIGFWCSKEPSTLMQTLNYLKQSCHGGILISTALVWPSTQSLISFALTYSC